MSLRRPSPCVLAYFFPERGSSLAARADDAGRPWGLAAWESFESLVAADVEPEGQTGLTGSISQVGPPRESVDSDFTNTGASPPRIQTCESGGGLPSSEPVAPGTPGTCTVPTYCI